MQIENSSCYRQNRFEKVLKKIQKESYIFCPSIKKSQKFSKMLTSKNLSFLLIFIFSKSHLFKKYPLTAVVVDTKIRRLRNFHRLVSSVLHAKPIDETRRKEKKSFFRSAHFGPASIKTYVTINNVDHTSINKM